MRITPLASGSQGNSLLFEAAGRRVLVDVGLEPADLEARLEAIGVRPRSIDAAVLTHRHKDHVRGATEFCRRHRVRVFAVRRTSRSVGSECHRLIRRIVPLQPFTIDDALRVLPIPVDHDAPDTIALRIDTPDGASYGHATDLGHAGGGVTEHLRGCDALYVEFNYDARMLAEGDYPHRLKARIASDTGHLSNDQARDLLTSLVHDGLRHVFVAHVSRSNNTPELALDAAEHAVAPRRVTVRLAQQDRPTAPFELAESGPTDSETVDEIAERVARAGEQAVPVAEQHRVDREIT